MADCADSDVGTVVARLKELARARGGLLTDDVADEIEASMLSDEQVEEVYAQLAKAGVEVRLGDNGVDIAAVAAPASVSRDAARMRPLSVEESDDIVALYLREIGAIPLLTAEEEVALARAYEQANVAESMLADAEAVQRLREPEVRQLQRRVAEGKRARERLIRANSRLVVHVAKRYMNHGLPFMDLIQEGSLGLIRAVEKYDFRRGYRFSTYATWWIRQSIIRALADQARTIRVPVHMSELIAKVRTVSNRLEQELGRDPTIEEIAAELDLSPRRVLRILEAAQRPVSLDMAIGQEADSELVELIADEKAPELTEAAGHELLREELVELLKGLSKREAQVLQLRYGLVDGRQHTLEEVGDALGVTRERIRQIETKAIRRLRHPTRSRKLRDYLR